MGTLAACDAGADAEFAQPGTTVVISDAAMKRRLAAILAAETKDYGLAADPMRSYLVLAPDAPDARAAKDKLLLAGAPGAWARSRSGPRS